MLAMRGVSLSYETVREWCLKFGQPYANGLSRKYARPGDQWHLEKCSSRSMDAFITCGVQLIRMATFWTSWSKAIAQAQTSDSISDC